MTLLGDGCHMFCPKCDYYWWEGDYAELHEGSEMECPKCNAKIRIEAIEMNPVYYGDVIEPEGTA